MVFCGLIVFIIRFRLHSLGRILYRKRASLIAQSVKNLPAMQETRFDSWVGKIPWRRKWQPSILIWRIPWTEEPGRLQSMVLQKLDTT